MKLLSREKFFAYGQVNYCRNVAFVSYISDEKPVLMLRYASLDASDSFGDFYDMISTDNGNSWSEAVPRFKKIETPEGAIRYGENVAFFDSDSQKLITMTNRGLYRKSEEDETLKRRTYLITIEINGYDPKTQKWENIDATNFGFQRIAVSFGFPIRISSGKILVPVQNEMMDENGNCVQVSGAWSNVFEPRVLIGQYDGKQKLIWEISKSPHVDQTRTSRGLFEPTLCEIDGGRIAMICRGSNEGYFDWPGYKWLTFSDDQGLTWSQPQPMAFTDGDLFSSASCGSAVFRSIKNGKIYWICNPALDQKPKGGWPRSPIAIYEIQEDSFSVKKDSMIIIDQRQQNDGEAKQLSNFRYYQDRKTGDVVIFLTRLGERRAKDWLMADGYRYRIAVD
jgi:hypothetical protein